MSCQLLDQNLTANFALNFALNLTSRGISPADLYNGFNFNSYKNYISFSTTIGAGTLTDGTNQTELAVRYYNYYGSRDPALNYSLCVYERALRDRNPPSNYWGEAYANLNTINLPSDFVDDIIAAPESIHSTTLEEFTIGSLDGFSRFSGWKYIQRIYYDIDNTLVNTINRYLYIAGTRTGIDITASGTVTYGRRTLNFYDDLKFTLNCSSVIQTYSSGTWHNYDTNPPFTA